MDLSYLCVLIAVFLPYFFTAYAKFSKSGYDNRAPRTYLENLQGKRKRAYWAALNSFESFAPFAAGVIIAHLLNAPHKIISLLALCFISCRIAYGLLYVADKPKERSLVWAAGFTCVLAIFAVAFLSG